MNSSETSAKYSWPSRAQNEEIQDSGVPDEVDMTEEVVRVTDMVDPDASGDARLRSSSRGRDEAPLADTVMVDSYSPKRRFGITVLHSHSC